MEKLLLKDLSFVTESGKQVILHGVNVLCRGRETGHIYPEIEKAFPYFRRMGFNLLRYGIFWDAVEPQPGKIDYEYLNKVKSIVKLAEENGMYIILDMHQDLFAQKFIDGAPDWACLDEGLPHPQDCVIWFEAYLKSEAIIKAADNFWANKEAEDGIGLLDHYEHMWEEIARVFAPCDNVIGLEPMNEPFMGSLAREAFGLGNVEMLKKNPQFDLGRPDLIPPEQAAEFMGIVASRLMNFDKTTLMDFYRRMQRAIQKHSKLNIVTGGNIYCSTDVPTGMEQLEGIGQIYAPHGYDSVVDSDRYEAYSKDNVSRVFMGKRQGQDRLRLPTIIGEWGAFPSRDFTNDLIRFMNGILEENLWGSAYCEYHPGQENDTHFSALCRAYPMETAGKLQSYHYDEAGKVYQMIYTAEKDGTTSIFLPFEPAEITCGLPIKTEKRAYSPERWLLKVTAQADGEANLTIKG